VTLCLPTRANQLPWEVECLVEAGLERPDGIVAGLARRLTHGRE
jgi:hypothetical protein